VNPIAKLYRKIVQDRRTARPIDSIMIHQTTLPFFRGDVHLTGQLFRNTDRLDVRQPAVIVTGSWLTVKEQMPETYALRLVERGYTVFTFDFTGSAPAAERRARPRFPIARSVTSWPPPISSTRSRSWSRVA
jgi:hypothetical protein